MTDLRLSAEDATDLEVISSCLQDAVTQVRDFAFLPHARRFALVLNRFRWENEKTGKSVHQRARAGLHFENVLGVKSRNISQDRPDGILNLLAVRFDELNAPSGIVTAVKSGLRLRRWMPIFLISAWSGIRRTCPLMMNRVNSSHRSNHQPTSK